MRANFGIHLSIQQHSMTSQKETILTAGIEINLSMEERPDWATNPDIATSDSKTPRQSNFVANDINIMTATRGSLWLDQGFALLVRGFAFITVGVLFWMSWVIFQQAQPAISKFGLGFLWSRDWDVPNLAFGALPFIYGTLVSSLISLLIAVPVGLAVALVTSEDFLPPTMRSALAFLIEIIAAIPSVIVGFWGIFVLIPFMQPIQTGLHHYFGYIPLFGTEASGDSMLIAGIILAIMILPTMAAISRDVLRAIPKELRSAAMSLGATRWETIFSVLIPAGASGLLGAVVLALGRALGETMAVTLVIGNSGQISASLLDAASTIPSQLASEFAEAQDGLHIGALMYLALILFTLTLLVNIVAVLLVRLINPQRV